MCLNSLFCSSITFKPFSSNKYNMQWAVVIRPAFIVLFQFPCMFFQLLAMFFCFVFSFYSFFQPVLCVARFFWFSFLFAIRSFFLSLSHSLSLLLLAFCSHCVFFVSFNVFQLFFIFLYFECVCFSPFVSVRFVESFFFKLFFLNSFTFTF